MPEEPFRILLVDDDDDDVALTREMLLRAKFALEIPSCVNGREALAYLRRAGDYAGAPRPDLILLDLNMPVMDGRELLREVKGDPGLGGIPVVILTSTKAAEEIVACYGLGANGYVNKPMNLSQFSELEQIIADFREAALRRARGA